MFNAECLTYAPRGVNLPFMKSLPKQTAVRDEAYLDFIRSLPCSACGAPAPSVAHHHPAAGHSSTSLKCDDTRTLSLCVSCHDLVHSKGKLSFWGDQEEVEVAIAKLNIRYLFALNVAHI